MRYLAPAKLNLFLHIIKRCPDGYHELQTLFQLIDYCDELDFEVRADNAINLQCNMNIPLQDNLVFKAAYLLQQHCDTPQGIDIYLHKRIPAGMGLGGGSSDAAITLKVLNHLWNCCLNDTQLMAYGKELGADIPLFIAAQSAWGEGRGEVLRAVDLPPRWYVVFIPPHQISTAAMFEHLELKRDCARVSMEDYLAGRTKNVFEAVVRKEYPRIATDMDWLNSRSTAYLTGSGGAFFASCESEAQATDLTYDYPAHLQYFIARGINEMPVNQLNR